MSLPHKLLAFANLVSGSLALIVALPRIHEGLWTAQMVASELPALTLISGAPALRKRAWSLHRLLGLLGVLIGVIPYLRWLDARRNMDSEMVAALGHAYENAIPFHIQMRLLPARWLPHNIEYLRTIENIEVERDVEFAWTPQRILTMDVYRSLDFDSEQERPGVIIVHGGGWRNGDKGLHFSDHHHALAYQGYVVFDIQYRLTERDDIGWPAQMEDIRIAIRHIKLKARRYGINPERIALYGRSAGGHLVLMTAATATGQNADTAVQAVVAAYAPVNMMLIGREHDVRALKLFGASSYQNPRVYRAASPLHQISAEMPPTLALHGSRDPLVTPLHAEMLQQRMYELGRPCVVLRVPWARHAFDAVRFGLGAQLTQYYVDRFLAKWLYTDEESL
jgi:acetyl esterase/lipase